MDKNYASFKTPRGYPGTRKDWIRQEILYRYLEENRRAIAFHAAEIWEIMIMGIAFGDGDFMKSLQFIINYGRDNDTVGAVAGMILGARTGYAQLPKDLRDKILTVNRDIMGIDLERLARTLVKLMP